MDSQALTLANRMVGNEDGAAALEMTVTGATLRFDADAVFALAGADMDASIDGRAVSFWQPHAVSRGSVLTLGRIRGAGQRAYLSVRGSFDLPEYLGSRATFTLGRFGGHGGRALRAGDVLRLNRSGLDIDCCHGIATEVRPA
jgi:urea carboxylase